MPVTIHFALKCLDKLDLFPGSVLSLIPTEVRSSTIATTACQVKIAIASVVPVTESFRTNSLDKYPQKKPHKKTDILYFGLWILVQHKLFMIFLNVNVLAFLLRVLLLIFKLMSLILVKLKCPVRDD